MSNAIGRTRWAIAEGYIPAQSTGGTRQLVSHETMCLLNAGDEDAHVEVRVYLPTVSRPDPIGLLYWRGARCTYASMSLKTPSASPSTPTMRA